MWAWIKRKWGRGRKSIYQFWDGATWRYADPMVVVRGLQDHPTFNWERDPVAVSMGDLAALAVCAKAIRDVFVIQPFDGQTGRGLTEQECLELLGRFSSYLGAVKKNGNTSPTPRESTEQALRVLPESIPETNTNASSDSGSTVLANEPSSPST